MTPFYGSGSTASRLQSHYEKADNFLPFTNMNFSLYIFLNFPDLGLSYGFEVFYRK